MADNPVERKTTFGTVAAYAAAAAGLALLNLVQADAGLISALPDWLEVMVLPLIPGAAAFVVAYQTKHRPGKLSESARAAAGIRGGYSAVDPDR
jgi:hypothetical protein